MWLGRGRRLVDAGHAILDDSKRYGIYLEESPKLRSVSRTASTASIRLSAEMKRPPNAAHNVTASSSSTT